MITEQEIATALRRPLDSVDSAEVAQWQMWIADALMLIDARLGDVTLLDQTQLDYVVREAVVAMVKRPDDATQVDISVDDGRVSRRYETGKGRVVILNEWWDLLSPQTDGGAFSVRPYWEPDRAASW